MISLFKNYVKAIEEFGSFECFSWFGIKNNTTFLAFPLSYIRDRASHNDVIGTAHLCMSKISAPGGEIDGKHRIGLNPTG